LRILLVEDHGVTAQMIQIVLTSDGHMVETAGDVATALELAEKHAFDLLLSDLGLPDGSGHDLMRQLRERGQKFPGIALSGYGQEEDIERSREAGFAAHLTKPASREGVVEVIASVTAGEMTTAAIEPKAESESPSHAEVPVYDADAALRRCFGKPEFLQQMVEHFLKESPELLDRLHAATLRGDAADVAATAHRLTGTAAYLKATAAVKAAQEVERIGMSDDQTGAAEAIEQLELQVGLLKEALIEQGEAHENKRGCVD
jgi:CheY-like chemotaxis protein